MLSVFSRFSGLQPGGSGFETAVIIRAIKPEDKVAWQGLWDGYLAFYEVTLSDTITESTWSRIAGEQGSFFALVAEDKDGVVVGFAHCLMHLNTWDVEPRCYLEDLYVAGSKRGGGVGRALIEAASAEARRLGAKHLYWFTNTGNQTARHLYDRIGTLSDFVRYDKKLS